MVQLNRSTIPAEVLSRHRPLLVDGNRLLAAKGVDIYMSRDAGESFERLARWEASAVHQMGASLRIGVRVGRFGYHILRQLPCGGHLAVAKGYVLHRTRDSELFRPVFRIPQGSRPLKVAVTPDGNCYFGEYFRNAERGPVHVYGSPDGREWAPVHTFPSGMIRHVHGVIHDPLRNGLWVLTGDDEEEAGIWFTSDSFRSLTAIRRGLQQARAVDAIPVPDGLIVPTDSPRIRNVIQLLDLSTSEFKVLHPLPGSAFHAVRSAGLFLVSTVEEPGAATDERGAALFASRDGLVWQRFAHRDPDLIYRLGLGLESVMRYPELALVPGQNDTGYIFALGRSVHGAEGRLLRWPVEAVEYHLRQADQ